MGSWGNPRGQLGLGEPRTSGGVSLRRLHGKNRHRAGHEIEELLRKQSHGKADVREAPCRRRNLSKRRGQGCADRHPLSNDPIRQYPENRAWRGTLNFGSAEAWRLHAASRTITMTFGAVLFEENAAGSNGIRIVLERISALPRLFGSLLQFRVDCRIVFGRCADGRFVGSLALCKYDRHPNK